MCKLKRYGDRGENRRKERRNWNKIENSKRGEISWLRYKREVHLFYRSNSLESEEVKFPKQKRIIVQFYSTPRGDMQIKTVWWESKKKKKELE